MLFDENGYISALTDLQADRQIQRDVGAPLGILWFGEDMPSAWDNWDIGADIFLKLRPVTDLLSREVVSDGAVEYRYAVPTSWETAPPLLWILSSMPPSAGSILMLRWIGTSGTLF